MLSLQGPELCKFAPEFPSQIPKQIGGQNVDILKTNR